MADLRSPGIGFTIVDNSQYSPPVAGVPYSAATCAATQGGELYKPTFVYDFTTFEQRYGAPKHNSAFYSYSAISYAPILLTRVAAIYPNFDFAGNTPADIDNPTTAPEAIVSYFAKQGYDPASMTYDEVVKDRTVYKVFGSKTKINFLTSKIVLNETNAFSDSIKAYVPITDNENNELYFNDYSRKWFMIKIVNSDGSTALDWQLVDGTYEVLDVSMKYDSSASPTPMTAAAIKLYDSLYLIKNIVDDSGAKVSNNSNGDGTTLTTYDKLAVIDLDGNYSSKTIYITCVVVNGTGDELVSPLSSNVLPPYNGLTIWFETASPGMTGHNVDIKITPVTYGTSESDGELYLREAKAVVYYNNVAVEDFGIVSFDPNDSTFFVPIMLQSAYIKNIYYSYSDVTVDTMPINMSDDFISDMSTYTPEELVIPRSLIEEDNIGSYGSYFYGVRQFDGTGFVDNGDTIKVDFDNPRSNINNIYTFASDDSNITGNSAASCYTDYSYFVTANVSSVNYAITEELLSDAYVNLDLSRSNITITNIDDIFQGNSSDGDFYEITADTITVSKSQLNELFVASVDYVLRQILVDESYVYTLVVAPFDDDINGLTLFNALKYNAEYRLIPFFIYDMNKNAVVNKDSAISYHSRLDSTWHGAVIWDYGYMYNKFLGRKVLMYPSLEMIADIMYSAANYKIWYAPAGQRRGIAGPFTELRNNPNKLDRDDLYGYPNRVNPLVFVNNFGVMLYGQKTLQTTTSKLDRINVALLIKYLVRRVGEVLPPMLFEFNDSIFESRVTDLLTPIFEDIYYNRGAEEMPYVDFKTTAFDAAQKKAVLVIHIKPRDVVEFIYVTISVDSAAVTEVSVQ